jgi:hypothetical protein
MASTLNTEFNYRYLVIGSTPWEKIKTLKGFLEGRKRASFLEEVSNKKYQAKIEKVKLLKEKNAPINEILEAEADVIEAESFLEGQKEAFELNKGEIKLLERLLEEYYEIVEPTRIEGYTDEQMFEANAELEFVTTVIREIQSEIIANGRPSPAKLLNAMSCPMGLKALKALNIIPPETNLLQIGDKKSLELN